MSKLELVLNDVTHTVYIKGLLYSSKYSSIFDVGFSRVVSTMRITCTQTAFSLVFEYGYIDEFGGLTP